MARISKLFAAQKDKILRRGLVSRRITKDYSKNVYVLPVPKIKVSAVYTDNLSPAHVGCLINAIDFHVPNGTRVFAAADGVVVGTRDRFSKRGSTLAYWNRGNYIDIKHRNGEYTWYEHLKHRGIIVKKGDRVKKGQLIGYSGDTGFSEHYHLHFQVNRYFGTKPTDYVTLRARFSNFRNVYDAGGK